MHEGTGALQPPDHCLFLIAITPVSGKSRFYYGEFQMMIFHLMLTDFEKLRNPKTTTAAKSSSQSSSSSEASPVRYCHHTFN